MAKRGGNRPTKVVMEAVNILFNGDEAGAVTHLGEFGEKGKDTIDRAKEFLAIRQERDLGPYTFERAPRGSKKGRITPISSDITGAIDGRTKIITLLKLEAKVKEILGKKDPNEIKATRDAKANREKLRRQLKEMDELLED